MRSGSRTTAPRSPESKTRLRYRTCGVLAAFALAAVAVACGRAGRPGSSTSGASAATTTSSPVVARPGQNGRSSSSSGSAARGASAAARSFIVPGGDNSIPDFGREAGVSERRSAVAALEAFLQARAKGDWAKVCSYLTGPTRRQLDAMVKGPGGGSRVGCAQAVAALSIGRPRAPTIGVTVLRMKGKTAFALFQEPNADKYVMPMQNEGNAWKMGQLAPLPYPLGTGNSASTVP